MKEIRIYNSNTRPRRRVALCVVILVVIFRVYHYYNEDKSFAESWPLWPCAIVLGIPVLLNLYFLMDRRAKIILSKEGIYDSSVHNAVVPWQVIKEAYALSIYGQQFICIAVDDNFKATNDKGSLLKRMSLFTKSLGAKELNLSVTHLDVDGEKMAAFIMQMKAADDMEREQLLSSGLLR